MTATRSYTTSTPQWQRFQTSLMAPAHAVAAHNNNNNKTNQVATPHVYSRQYAAVYHQRYQQLAPYCWQAIDHHHNNNNNNDCTDKRVNRIVELAQQSPHKNHKINKNKNTTNDDKDNNNVLYWAVGTLVKETMDVTETPLVGQHVRASDTLFLEDDSGRVTLEFPNTISNNDDNNDKDKDNHATGVINQHAWPTGAVVAVQGRLGPDGTLRVTQIVPPAPSLAMEDNNNNDNDVVMTHATTTATTTTTQQQPCYLMLVSGLDCGGANVPATTRDLLLHFLQGRLACSPSSSSAVAVAAPHQIAALLVAGGWAARTRQGLQDADAWLDQVLATGISCHVVPGQFDATTANWPQRPLHKSCTPRCSSKYRQTLFHATPNPYQATFGGTMDDDKNNDKNNDDKDRHYHPCPPPPQPVTVVATDGFNVRAQQDVTAVVVQQQPSSSSSSNNNNNKDTHCRDSLYRKPSALQVMQQHLALRHLCPVGPAIVPTMPHAQSDPMVLSLPPPPVPSSRCLYVTGGHDTFSTSSTTTTGSGGTTTTTRLVAVPKFSTTGMAILVEIQSLQVQVLKFVDETE